ncbi:ATPase family gene 2 protein homolog A isoform X2 [Rhynchophorus ferrugineus]|uniref:ATPase family gene 2 protein homolog A isoform X2 n=1 Tax=Rhynchophorus ferrugineus TaxID=354439 RepID=UPI003FCE8129
MSNAFLDQNIFFDMSQNKSKKSSPWFQCEQCSAFILHRDIENHEGSCPPTTTAFQHTFIHNDVLCGILEGKPTEEVKSLSTREKDGLVFLSQASMQLCSITIGEKVILQPVNGDHSSFIKQAWPTNEKTLTSVLITKNALDTVGLTLNDPILVKKLGPTGIASHNSCIIDKINELSVSDSDKFYLIDNHTKWKVYKSQENYFEETNSTQSYQVEGLDNEVADIQELMNASLGKVKFPALIPIKSVLLYGSSGTGKTTLAKMLAKESRANTIEIYLPDLYSKHSSSPEEAVKELFDSALKQTPSVIILDEIDVLCPIRNGRVGETEKKIVSTVLTYLDSISTRSNLKIFIIATTNKIDGIDPALRRCGRLDREVEISSPNPNARYLILRHFLRNSPLNIQDSDLREIALMTPGFVGADLQALCSQASLLCARRKGKTIEMEDFRCAVKKIRPSAMREIQIEVPNIKWTDIGGQENLKLILKQAVEWPLKHPESFTRLGITPPRGVLMYGPPGCSKTMIAKALASESGLNFLSIKGPELFSKWVGESERAIREVFRKARQVAPSVIFFDEIDALGGERSSGSSTSVQDRVLAQLLTELDGVTPLGDVTILAATNRPDRIDKALLRPGRLDRIVYVPLPDPNTRREIFRIKLSKMPTTNVNVEELITKTGGYSGAEINAVCHEAAMMALEENLNSEVVDNVHFQKALDLIKPRTPKSLISLYEEHNDVKI